MIRTLAMKYVRVPTPDLLTTATSDLRSTLQVALECMAVVEPQRNKKGMPKAIFQQ